MPYRISLLLLGNTNSASTATSGLGMLTTDTEEPVMTETTVSTDLLETLQILTELGIETVGDRLTKGTVLPVLLSVQEPVGDLVLSWVKHDSLHATDLVLVQLTGTLRQVNISLLADQVGETT